MINEELKPVQCGCGGKPRIAKKILMGNLPDVYVLCENCSIRTREYYSVTEAITAWNKAMGERTATVKDFGHPCGTYGYCSNCGGYCVNEDPYCPHCGAKIKWE